MSVYKTNDMDECSLNEDGGVKSGGSLNVCQLPMNVWQRGAIALSESNNQHDDFRISSVYASNL